MSSAAFKLPNKCSCIWKFYR